jgi:hypothetical protein
MKCTFRLFEFISHYITIEKERKENTRYSCRLDDNIVDRVDEEHKFRRTKKMEITINATSVHPFINTA